MADRVLDVGAITDEVMWEVGRRAVEDALIDMRDSGVGILGRGNGLVANSKDGTPSSVIRLSIEDALRIGIDALVAHQVGTRTPA